MPAISSPDTVTCCYSDCHTILIETINSAAITRADHSLCRNCRSIIICSAHFEMLATTQELFLCPACNVDEWQHVSIAGESPSSSSIEFNCHGVYEDKYSRGSSLINQGLVVTSTSSGCKTQTLDGRLTATVTGKVIHAALSPEEQHIAIVYQQGHECILEVHGDSGRPWRLRSDTPHGVHRIAFFDEYRLAALICRQEGHLELIELMLESGHTITTRRICTTSTQSDDTPPLQLCILDGERVVTSCWSGGNYWLETIEVSTGTKRRTTAVPYLPSLLRVGPNAHFLIGSRNGAVGLIKDEAHVELLSDYELVDAHFGRNGELYLTSRTHGLKINLQTGASHERVWDSPVLGLTDS